MTGRRFAAAAELHVGAHGDRHEREADRVGEQLVGDDATPLRVGRVLAPGAGALPVDPEAGSLVAATRGRGRPLPARVRRPFEQRLGADLSGVRVHTGDAADRLNQRLDAEAVTGGQDIWFRRGGYSPGTPSGHGTLAHELVHVVQQSGSPTPLLQRARKGQKKGGDQPKQQQKQKPKKQPKKTTPPTGVQKPTGQREKKEQEKAAKKAVGTTPKKQKPTQQKPTQQTPQKQTKKTPGKTAGMPLTPAPGSKQSKVQQSKVQPLPPTPLARPAYGAPGTPRPATTAPGTTPQKRPRADSGPPGAAGRGQGAKRLRREGPLGLEVHPFTLQGMIEHLTKAGVRQDPSKPLRVGVVVWNINHLTTGDEAEPEAEAPSEAPVASEVESDDDSGSESDESSSGDEPAVETAVQTAKEVAVDTAVGDLAALAESLLKPAGTTLVKALAGLKAGLDPPPPVTVGRHSAPPGPAPRPRSGASGGNRAPAPATAADTAAAKRRRAVVRRVLSQHETDVELLRSGGDQHGALRPGLEALSAWRRDKAAHHTPGIREQAARLERIRGLGRIWNRLHRLRGLLVAGPRARTVGATADRRRTVRTAIGDAAADEIAGRIDALFAHVSFAEVERAIHDLKTRTVRQLTTQTFLQSPHVNLVLVNEMNLGMDVLAAGLGPGVGLSRGPLMLAKAKVADKRPAGRRAPIVVDGQYVTAKQYESYPAVHRTEEDDPASGLTSRGTFYVTTSGGFVAPAARQPDDDPARQDLIAWNKSGGRGKATFRGVVVHRFSQGGQELWAGVVHTTPSGSNLHRTDIWRQLQAPLGVLAQLAAHFKVPLLVGGDFYISAEGIVNEPSADDKAAYHRAEPGLMARIKATNVARNLYLEAEARVTDAQHHPQDAAALTKLFASVGIARPTDLSWDAYWATVRPTVEGIATSGQLSVQQARSLGTVRGYDAAWTSLLFGGEVGEADLLRNEHAGTSPGTTLQRALDRLGYRIVAGGDPTNPKPTGTRQNKVQLADLFIVNDWWQTALGANLAPDSGRLKPVDDEALSATSTYWQISDHSPAVMLGSTVHRDAELHRRYDLDPGARLEAFTRNLAAWANFERRMRLLPGFARPGTLDKEPGTLDALYEQFDEVRRLFLKVGRQQPVGYDRTVAKELARLVPPLRDLALRYAKDRSAVELAHLQWELEAKTRLRIRQPLPRTLVPRTDPAVTLALDMVAWTPFDPINARAGADGPPGPVPGAGDMDLDVPPPGPPPPGHGGGKGTPPGGSSSGGPGLPGAGGLPPGSSSGGKGTPPGPGSSSSGGSGLPPGSSLGFGGSSFDIPSFGGLGGQHGQHGQHGPPPPALPPPGAMGEVEHVEASCYLSAVIHVFASHPHYRRLLARDPNLQAHQAEPLLKAKLRAMVEALEGGRIVTGAQVREYLGLLAQVNGLMTGPDFSRMGQHELVRRATANGWQPPTEVQAALASKDPEVRRFGRQALRAELRNRPADRAELVTLQQDAGEILEQLLVRLGFPAADKVQRTWWDDLGHQHTNRETTLRVGYDPDHPADDIHTALFPTKLTALPDVLTFLVERQLYEQGRPKGERVPIPGRWNLSLPEVLVLQPSLLPGPPPTDLPRYRLIHVVEHQPAGDLRTTARVVGGHYVSHHRLPGDGAGWYTHDDMGVPQRRQRLPDEAQKDLLRRSSVYVYQRL